MSRTFRTVAVKQNKDCVYRITNMRVTSSPASSYVHGITASSYFTAVPGTSLGTVAVLPNDFSKYDRNAPLNFINAHMGEITDLAFSPHSDYVLATTARDNNVAVFVVPSAGLTANHGAPAAVYTGLTGAQCIAWHPTVRGLVAIGSKDGVSVISLDFPSFPADAAAADAAIAAAAPAEEGRILYSVPTGDTTTVTWSDDGALIACTTKSGSAFVFNPRTTSGAPAPLATDDLKTAAFVCITGTAAARTQQVFVAGLNRSRSAVYKFFSVSADGTPSAAATSAGQLGLSSGQILGAFDRDAALIYLTTRSSPTVHIFEVSASRALAGDALVQSFFTVTPAQLATGTKGFAFVPKRALNVLDAEVDRFMSHVPDGVEVFSVSAIRKAKGWFPELFPPTLGLTAASTLDNWADGNDVAPALVSLEPGCVKHAPIANATPAPAAAAPAAAAPAAAAAAAAAAPEETKTAAAAAPEPEAAVYQSAHRAALDSKLSRTIFQHTSGVEPGHNKDHYTYGIPKVTQLPFGHTLVANSEYYALPVKTGQVFVRTHACVGRVNAEVPTLAHHAGAITGLALSHLEPSKLATCAEDGVIAVHRLPAPEAFAAAGGDLPATASLAPPAWTFSVGDSRVNVLKFHPYVAGVLVACVFNGSSGADEVLVFNVSDGTEGGDVGSLARKYTGLTHQRVTDIDFAPDCVTIALAAKDNTVTVATLPSGSVVGTFAPPQKTKELFVRFADNDNVITMGYTRGTERSVSFVNIAEAIASAGGNGGVRATVTVPNVATMMPIYDSCSGVLLVGGVGSLHYHIIHVSSEAPHLDYLSAFTSKGELAGAAPLPKRVVDAAAVEILRSVQLSKGGEAWPVSWRVPRKRKDLFQDDIFAGGAFAGEPAVASAEWFSGAVEKLGRGQAKHTIKTVSLRPAGMQLLSDAPAEELTEKQKKYVERKKATEAVAPTGFLGHTSGEEVMAHFREKAEKLPVSTGRFDATTAQHNDVDDSEWD